MSSYSTIKRSLEIELISGEGLMVNSKPLKRSKTYCIVRIDDKHQTSKLYDLGGSNPIWNDKISMDITLNGSVTVRFISIEVYYRKSGGGGQDKIVGCAKIPINDFLGGFAPPQGHLNFLSYRLRDEYGDKCGIVNVSIIVKVPEGKDVMSLAAPVAQSSTGCSSQAAAASNGQMWRARKSSTSMGGYGGYGGRVVTGVPVWCAYQQHSS